MENSESFSVMQRIKHKAIWYICQIHTNGKYEYFKCKLKSIGWEGGSEDAVCPCRWTDRHIRSCVYEKVRPASLYTLKTFSMALM